MFLNTFVIKKQNDNFIIKTNFNIYVLKKKSIKYIHIFDEMFDNCVNDYSITISCPNIFYFECILEKIINYYNIYSTIVFMKDKQVHDVFSRWSKSYFSSIDGQFINDCYVLCDFLNCEGLLNLISNYKLEYNSYVSDDDFIRKFSLINI